MPKPKQHFWSCEEHNTAGNHKMGCPYCYYWDQATLEAYLKQQLLKVRKGAYITPILKELIDTIGKYYTPKYPYKRF